jgi:hypothetical protein
MSGTMVRVDPSAGARGMVDDMGDPRQAMNARAMGNYGLWETLRRRPDLDDYAHDEDYQPTATSEQAGGRGSWWVGIRGRLIGWSLAAAVVVAYVNHWPGGGH